MEFQSHYSGSSGNLYTVKTDTCTLAIEAGVTTDKMMKALNYKASEVAGVLISHNHQDHCKSVEDMARLGVDCYMTRETAQELDFKKFQHRLIIVEPGKLIQIGEFKVIPFETTHDCIGSVGFLITDGVDKLIYATDTAYIRNRFRGLTIIACECNWDSEHWVEGIDEGLKRRVQTTHLGLDTLKDFLNATDLSKLQEIHLLHMSNSNADAEYCKKSIMELTGCEVHVC